jgi:processive 1,2-diacylglycerol beta-glucosyltransferase
MTTPRVLVVSGSAGHGHTMAARALATALRRRHRTLDVAHVDGVARMAHWFRGTYRWGYVKLVDRAPLLWRALYHVTDQKTSAAGHALSVLAGRGFVRLVKRWRPHLVVCTHFLAPELLSRAIRRGRLETRLQAVVTDHDAHRAWYWPAVERYYVASDLVKGRFALKFGLPRDRIEVTGIPVRPGFGARHDLVALRARYGLDPARPLVLFLSGGFAAGPMRQSILGLWMDRPDAQVVAICGTNARLRRRIAALPRPTGAVLHPLGFVEDPSPFVAAADVVVAKSGGITVSECSAAGTPLVVAGSIPGQEERNADAAVEAGAAVRALSADEVRLRLTSLLAEPDRLRAMGRAARRFGRPRAAVAIADAIAAQLAPPVVAGPHFHGAV